MGRKEKATPKAYQVRISTNALQNIDEITGYIAFINLQPMNAIKVGDAIFATIDRIELNPLAFKECVELPTKTKMYRTAACHSWSIIFKITSSEIVILGVLHSARRPSKLRALRRVK
jgi:plasmid stabilization system protein ParE